MAGGATARIGMAAVVVVAVLAAASVHLVAEGRAELLASDAAWAKGDGMGAAVHARSAARAYVPGAAHMDLGYERLRAIAETCERKGDLESALFAWRAILSATTGSRPFSAGSEAGSAAEGSVARLSATLSASGRTPSSGRRPIAVQSSLAADVVPRVGWGALLLGGALLFWGAGLRMTSRAWGSDGGRIVPAQVRIAAVMALVGLLAWLAGLIFG